MERIISAQIGEHIDTFDELSDQGDFVNVRVRRLDGMLRESQRILNQAIQKLESLRQSNRYATYDDAVLRVAGDLQRIGLDKLL